MKDKQVSIMEYVKMFNVPLSRQGVLWRINNNMALPYVKKTEMIGRGYVLTVSEQNTQIPAYTKKNYKEKV